MRFSVVLTLVLLLLLLPAGSIAQSPPEEATFPSPQLLLRSAWASPPNAEGESELFLLLENVGEGDMALLGLESSAAALTLPENAPLTIPAQGQLDLHTAGSTIRVQGLDSAADSLPLTLHLSPIVEGEALLPDAPMDDATPESSASPERITPPYQVSVTLPLLDSPPPLAEALRFEQFWARASIIASTPSAAYLSIHNEGTEDASLLAARTAIAEFTELHTMVMDGEVMRMEPLLEPIPLLAGETVRLEPGGMHVMLINLQEALLPGALLPISLELDSGALITLLAPVQDASQAAPAPSEGMSHGHGGSMMATPEASAEATGD